jgi:hypothetical protein
MKARKNKKESFVSFSREFFLVLTGLIVLAASSTRNFAQTEVVTIKSSTTTKSQTENPEKNVISKSSAKSKTSTSTEVAPTIRNENREAVYSKNTVTKSCQRESDCGQYASCIVKENQSRCVALYSGAEQIKITDNKKIRKEQGRLLVKSEQREVFANSALIIGAGFALFTVIGGTIVLLSISGPSFNCNYILCL